MSDPGFALVRAPFKDVGTGETHAVGDRIYIDDPARLARWVDEGLISPVELEEALEQRLDDWPWGGIAGRDLRPWPVEKAEHEIVALLNVWNDRPALEATVSTWADHVDRVVVADGAYAGVPVATPESDDGTVEYLREVFGGRLTEFPVPGFQTQIDKRTALLRAGSGILFIVDADEYVTGPENLRSLPGDLDVGWVVYRNPVYSRTQTSPRLIRWRENLTYRHRHHWVYAGDSLLVSHQLGGRGVDHHIVPIAIQNQRGIGRPESRIRADRVYRAHQATLETAESRSGENLSASTGREPLRIVQLARFDAGMVCYRLHSAINTCTPHESLLGTRDWGRVYQEPRQYNVLEDREPLRRAVAGADIVHCHLQYHELDELGIPHMAGVVIHHHGTMYRSEPGLANERDGYRAGLRLVSNLELMQYGDGLHYLPNPVPVAQYRQLRREHGEDAMIVAHMPSKPEIKGTDVLRTVVESLQSDGIPIRMLMLTDTAHGEALRLKASADVCFDSFDLGMQCSGLEAAAMGLPVIAGDETVKAAYERWIGYCPYTFAGDAEELSTVLRRMWEDPEWRHAEAIRVTGYVLAYHDYAAVAERYLDLLEEAFGWKEKLTLGQLRPIRS